MLNETLTVITLSGQARTGKDKFAQALTESLQEDGRLYIFTAALADPLKTKCAELLNVPEYIFRNSEVKDRPIKSEHDSVLHSGDYGYLAAMDEKLLSSTTPRQLLIKLGTLLESFREDKNTLCYMWLEDLKLALEDTRGRRPVVLVPDARLLREVQFFKKNFLKHYAIQIDYKPKENCSAVGDKTEKQINCFTEFKFDYHLKHSEEIFSPQHSSVIEVVNDLTKVKKFF